MPSERATFSAALTFAAEQPDGFINPRKLSAAERLEMIELARDEKILAISFEAVVYWDGPNVNNFRFASESLPDMVARADAKAKSDTPPILLHEHRRSVFSRVGQWTGARIVTDDDGRQGIAASFDITDPVTQVKYLRLELDRFSVGADTTSIRCSACGAQSRSVWWFDCMHEPGEECDGEKVEAIVEGDLVENSFTADPAVEGTAILAAQRLAQEGGTMPTEDKGSASAADMQELAAFRAAKKGQADELAALKAQQEESAAALAAANTATFDAVFGANVGSKVLACEREDQRILFDAKGKDAYIASLAARPDIVGHDGHMVGETGGTPAGSIAGQEPDIVETVLGTLEFARRHGLLKGKTDRATLEAGRFGSMRFDGANRKVG